MFGENPLMFTQVIIRKRKTDVRRMDIRRTHRRTDGHTDDQRETIIPRHYCVVGYNDIYPINSTYIWQYLSCADLDNAGPNDVSLQV